MPACALLVGMRPWDQFAALRELAHEQEALIDIDQVEADQLQADLRDYLDDVLALTPAYGTQRRGIRRTIARRVAEALTSGERERSGEFLSASLFANWLVSYRPQGVDPEEVDTLTTRVPHTIPEMLRLDLSARAEQQWLLPVLMAIAQAHGEGLPASVIRLDCASLRSS